MNEETGVGSILFHAAPFGARFLGDSVLGVRRLDGDFNFDPSRTSARGTFDSGLKAPARYFFLADLYHNLGGLEHETGLRPGGRGLSSPNGAALRRALQAK